MAVDCRQRHRQKYRVAAKIAGVPVETKPCHYGHANLLRLKLKNAEGADSVNLIEERDA